MAKLIPEYLPQKPDRLILYKCKNEKNSYFFFMKCDGGIMTTCKENYEGGGA